FVLKNSSFIFCPVLVPASPPRPVSLKVYGSDLPTSDIAFTTSSNGTIDFIPARAISAEIIAFITLDEFLKVQGYSTSPPIGSHTKPSTFTIAIDAASKHCSTVPPYNSTVAAAAIAAAEPHSA